uniref:Uncharacterized protein n=2 Tax=Palpitomonas bilix TaxID=652834 RepID=A0A7S3CY56_9EUKA|mmetsp:Transcript_14507/g.36974  ORF Transcript_14507/g.36974 Transcript_14507/m.36974 type:complete len:174 (+) Transcript_14507:183-704(+)
MLSSRRDIDKGVHTKVTLVGTEKCGKTSLARRYVSGSFSPEYRQSLGAEVLVKDTAKTNKSAAANVHVWCVGGAERLKVFAQQYIVGSHVVGLCFDTTDASSFEECVYWYNEIRRVSPSSAIFLVGTKTDMADEATLSAAEIEEQAKEWGIAYIPTSSKSGTSMLATCPALHR